MGRKHQIHFNYNRLNCKTAKSRSDLLRGLVSNLFMHERIVTTFARARAARTKSDRLITLAKRGTPQSIEELAKFLYTSQQVDKAQHILAPRYENRRGGYTRLLKLHARKYDSAKMAVLELVDNPFTPLLVREQKLKDSTDGNPSLNGKIKDSAVPLHKRNGRSAGYNETYLDYIDVQTSKLVSEIVADKKGQTDEKKPKVV